MEHKSHPPASLHRKRRPRALTNIQISPSPKKKLTTKSFANLYSQEPLDPLQKPVNGVRPMNKVGEVADMLPPDISHVSPVCALHENCIPVDKTSFLAAIQLICSESRTFNTLLQPHDKHLWYGGQVIAREVLEKGAWKEDECKYCYIEEFLCTDVYVVFLAMLFWAGKTEEFRRCLDCGEYLGYSFKIMELEDWIVKLVAKRRAVKE
jgi:hypothetical protein